MMLFGAMLLAGNTLGFTMLATLNESLDRKVASGCFRWKTTVDASGASTDCIESVSRNAAEPLTFCVTARSIENLTAAESSAVPSENLRFGFILKVYVRPSLEIVG